METQNDIDIYFSFFAGTAIILISVLAIIVFFVVYRKRLFDQQIHIEKKESEYRLELLKSSIETAEQERKRIASDLHDDIGSHLSALKMLLNAIKRKSTEPTELELLADESKSLLDNTISSVRTISHNLSPVGLEKFGLANTIEDLCYAIKQSNTLDINLVIQDGFPELAQEKELAIYRIIQELITNTIRHAQASSIQIHFEKQHGIVIITYSDNGRGINKEKLDKVKGLGFSNIESRVLAFDGKIHFDTAQGKGLSVRIELSL